MCPYSEADTPPPPMGEWKREPGAPSISPKDASVQWVPAAALDRGWLETVPGREWLLRFYSNLWQWDGVRVIRRKVKEERTVPWSRLVIEPWRLQPCLSKSPFLTFSFAPSPHCSPHRPHGSKGHPRTWIGTPTSLSYTPQIEGSVSTNKPFTGKIKKSFCRFFK